MKPGTLPRAVKAAKQAEGRKKLTQLGHLLAELLEWHPPINAVQSQCAVCHKGARQCPATRMLALLVDLNWRPE
jgi:hypothetical protein